MQSTRACGYRGIVTWFLGFQRRTVIVEYLVHGLQGLSSDGESAMRIGSSNDGSTAE